MSAPERTALYRIYGDGGLLLYIGISKDFGKRWQREAKDFPWWSEHRRMTVDWYDFRSAAAQAEDAAIEAEDPKYNIRRPAVSKISLLPYVPSPPTPPPAPPAGPMLTYREAAGKLGVSLFTLYQLLREGTLHSLDAGPQTKRIATVECQAYVDGLLAAATGGTLQPEAS